MSNQIRGFSGVGKLSASKDDLIPPHVLAQTPNWNPLKHKSDEAKSEQWQKMREQVSMDSWVERQDNHTLQNINRLEQQFAARVNAGQSQSTDQELFPERHAANNQANAAQATATSNSSLANIYQRPKPTDKVNEINWSMWAAAVCLFLVGAGSFGVWMFSGRPDVGSIVERFTASFSSDSAQVEEVAVNHEPNVDSDEGSTDGAASSAGNADESAIVAMDNTEPETTSAAEEAFSIFDENESDAPSANAAQGAGTAATRALSMGDYLFNQDLTDFKVDLSGALPGTQPDPSKQILLSPVSDVTKDSLMAIKLPALPKLKKPADNATQQDKLSQEEYRWCALVQMGTTEISSPPEACASPEVIRYGQDIAPYLPYFKVLGLYRAFIEKQRTPMSLGVSLSDLEIEQWMKYQLTSTSDILNERDSHHCGQSWVVINGLFAMTPYNMSMAAINNQIAHFNQVCGNKVVDIKEQQGWMGRNDFLVFVQSLMMVQFGQLTSDWTKFTYLPPAKGNAKQQRPEINEAQKLLKQLGYKVNKVTGKQDNPTREAIKLFEQDMGLEGTGELTFSILLRLRLATQGYDSSKAWEKSLQST